MLFGYAISLLLVAVGAILAFAVTATTNGINVHAVGWILLGVGLVGFVISLILASYWADRVTRRGRYDDPEV